MKTPKKPTPEQEAISFMCSMVELVERRGLRYVDEEFGRAIMGMATLIVDPNDPTSNGGPKDAISPACALIEEFPTQRTPDVRCGWRLPVEVLRTAVLMAEAGMREMAAAKTTEASKEARPIARC